MKVFRGEIEIGFLFGHGVGSDDEDGDDDGDGEDDDGGGVAAYDLRPHDSPE